MKAPEVHTATQPHLQGLIRRPATAVLLHGPEPARLRQIADWVAQRLTCPNECDGDCASCLKAAHGNHPDIIVLTPDEKGKIGIEVVHQLQHSLSFGQYESKARRVVVVDQADTLTLPAQQALLKTLEEPPVDTTMVLTATRLTALLDTVQSRCRPLYVPPSGQPQADPLVLPLLEGELLSRLVAAQKLGSDAKTVVINLQHYVLSEPVAADSIGLRQHSRRLDAVTRLHERIQANVAPRAALEAFVLESAS